MFDQCLVKEINELKSVFNQIKTEVDQCSVDKKYFEIENKELLIENDRLLEQILSQDIVCIAMHSHDDNDKYASMEKIYVEAYNQCLELEAELVKKKEMVEKDVNALEYACMYEKQIQELLVYVSDTCPSSRNNNEKLVDVTPMIKNSGSKNMSTSKHSRISRPSSSNRNNKKVEANPRNVKSSLKKMNRVSVINEKVKHGVCSACNECLFNASHDMCVVDYLNDVNARARNKSVKSVKNKEWKPTGKVFTNVGHK
nr:hypothetical protein [Tanacetum cinerariifolium]